MRNISILKGKEINKEAITKLKEIARLRYAPEVYNSSYWGVEDLDYLANLHCVNPNDEILILGEDWFLCYSVTEETVEFLEWVALSNVDNKITQTLEMLKTLKSIFLKNSQKKFITSMRHDSSFPFYLNMLKRGYFEEISHSYSIDICHGFAPDRLKFLEDEYADIDTYLNSEEAKEHPEYSTFILHDTIFTITNTFVKRYTKNNNS